MQKEIPILSQANKPVMAPNELVSKCNNRLDAIRLCVQLSKYSNETISRALSIDPGHWSRIMQGHANFPDARSHLLMEVCGNLSPMQWEANYFSYKLTLDAKESRKAELLAELAELERAA